MPGSVITVAANGLNPGRLPEVWANGQPASVLNFERKLFAGLPGVNDLIQFQLPEPLDSGRVELRVGDSSVLYPPATRVYVVVE